MASIAEPGERWLTLPNVITLARLPLAGAVWLAPDRPELLIPILLAAALSDLLDGRVARALKATSSRGAWLDPICDKVFVLSLLAALLVTLRPAAEIVLLIALRELMLLPLFALYLAVPALHRRRRLEFRAGPLGKLATVAQFAAVAELLWAPEAALPLALVAGVTGVAAVVDYVQRAVRGAGR